MHRFSTLVAAISVALAAVPCHAAAQERAYFVTYDHYLEEPGNLEVAVVATTGFPKANRGAYTAPWLELEYGVNGWWTTELYLEGITTSRDGSGFTGWRWENRFRPFKSERRINPVLYIEYEQISEASRIQKEIVGSGGLDFRPIHELRRERAREIEGKLILSSVAGPWNIAENVVVEKNLSEDEGLELGYSIGISRSLGRLASASRCRLCRENFLVGLEAYGGLGSTQGFGVRGARHFLAPVVGWRVSDRSTLKVSTGLGLTEASDRVLVRAGWTYELSIRGAR